MTASKFSRWLLLVALFISMIVTGLSFASAQCTVRADWPFYSVQRGDTLRRIADRYGTTTAVLAAANCLQNPNLIYVGQSLRIPPASGPVNTPAPIYPADLSATFQSFERGFMTWKAGTGEIGVFFGSGGMRVFSARTYGNLPDGPWPLIPQPAGTYRPIFGFGKVWLNFPDVAQGLGWAITTETGYLMRVYPPNSSTYQFVLPDGRTVYVNNNQSWSYTSGIPTIIPPSPTPIPGPIVTSTQAAYQTYQGGFMIWEANTQNVVSFFNNGSYRVSLVRNYGPLPDNPVLDPTPAGYVRPAFGFGKVWGNYGDIRQILGWAATPETGYITSFRTTSRTGYVETCFRLPDNRVVVYTSASGAANWYYGASCG